MATQDKVARRYAKAIFQVLSDGKSADKVVEELEGFSKLVSDHKELSLLIDSPGFSPDQKSDVISDLVVKAKLSKAAAQIVQSLARMERVDHLEAIVRSLRGMILESEGIQPIQVFTADSVSAEEKKLIETKFGKVLGKKVEATYEAQPALIGGLRVVAGGRTYDGTVAGWLDAIKESLVEGEA